MKKQNPAHILFEKHLRELELEFDREVRFHSIRKWRLDYVLAIRNRPCTYCENGKNVALSCRTAVEIEGAIWTNGRHTRGKGYQADLDKYNAATMAGYRVLRFSTDDVLHGRAKAFIAKHLLGNKASQMREL